MPNAAAIPELDVPLFARRQPAGALGEFVELLWVWRGPVRAGGKDRMMPTGAASLVINLLEDELRIYDGVSASLLQRLDGAGFVGVHAHAFVIDAAEQAYVAGVSFRPGGAWPFVNAAQDEIANSHNSLRDVWGVDVASLRERLLLTSSARAQLDLLEHTLTNQLCRPLAHHPAVMFALRDIMRDPARAQIAMVSERASLSSRRLARLFEQQVGLTPKLYARLLRFRHVLQHAHSAHTIDWAQIALECGYYDQPHFNRDFKAFSGFTPKQYLAARGEFINHVLVK